MENVASILGQERSRIIARLRDLLCDDEDCLDPTCLHYRKAIAIVADGMTKSQADKQRAWK